MLGSGFLFAVSYVLLRQAFLNDSFLNVFIISRLSAGSFALFFLFLPEVRKHLFTLRSRSREITSKEAFVLLTGGQIMGALSVTLIIFGVSLANPALVNAFFGVQYLVILAVSLLLAKKHPHLLDEPLSKSVITQKVAGASVLSLGLYLLAK